MATIFELVSKLLSDREANSAGWRVATNVAETEGGMTWYAAALSPQNYIDLTLGSPRGTVRIHGDILDPWVSTEDFEDVCADVLAMAKVKVVNA